VDLGHERAQIIDILQYLVPKGDIDAALSNLRPPVVVMKRGLEIVMREPLARGLSGARQWLNPDELPRLKTLAHELEKSSAMTPNIEDGRARLKHVIGTHMPNERSPKVDIALVEAGVLFPIEKMGSKDVRHLRGTFAARSFGPRCHLRWDRCRSATQRG
jgi:hypothetical protein